MRFWDTSAIVPLLVAEPQTPAVERLISSDPDMLVWWGTRPECVSALARRTREGTLTLQGEAQARVRLHRLGTAWAEVQPTDWLRAAAELLLELHPLRAADAFQLAAAVASPPGVSGEFVSLDGRLRAAVAAQGFTVLP